LKTDPWTPPIASKKGHGCCEIGTRTRSSYSNKVPVQVQLPALIPKIFEHSVTVCERSGEWILGSKSVFNTYDSTPRVKGIMRALQLLGIKVSAEKSPAVKIQQRRQRIYCILWAVDTHRNSSLLAISGRNPEVFYREI
jgi:hypothetical protein